MYTLLNICTHMVLEMKLTRENAGQHLDTSFSIQEIKCFNDEASRANLIK